MSTSRRHSEPMVCRLGNAIARYIGFGSDDFQPPSPSVNPSAQESVPLSAQHSLRLMPSPEATVQLSGHKWRRHPQLRAYEAPITDDVRDSRHKAVRGLFAARAGAIDVATEHFSIAAQCEAVDLTAVPGFWKLTRRQMQTAVDAYEAVGRYRDAAALDAQIATIFRPSLVGAKLEPIVPRKPQPKAAST